MTDFNVINEEELCAVLNRLLGMQWPMPISGIPEVISGMGWAPLGRWAARSTLPVSMNIVSFTGLKDEVGSIQFDISDRLPDESAAGKKIVMAAFPGAKQMVSSCLGFEPTKPRPWDMFGFSWEMADGRRVDLMDGSDVIVLDIWSKRNADIERDEIRLGIDPSAEPEVQ